MSPEASARAVPQSVAPRRSLPTRVLRVLAILTVLYAVMVSRAVLESRAAFAHGQRALDSSDVPAAISHFRAAARWYAPGNSFSLGALDRLLDLGRQAELDRDRVRALSAYQACHAAIHASASLFVPHRDRLRVADGRIAALRGAERPPEILAQFSEAERVEAYERGLLPAGARVGFTALALAGFGLWVGALVRFWLRGLGPDDRPLPGALARWGLAALAGFVCFVCGIAFA